MSTVTLSIGPKSYTVACADGQEAHIKALGAMIAEKYAQLGSARAPLEAENLLFAALFMADELDQARKRLAEKPEPAPAAEPVDPEALAALQNAIAALEADLAAAREAAARPAPAPAPATPQFDLFGGAAAPDPHTEEIAARLEALAERAEANAAALEAAVPSA
ncbi:cell division protein ZapA [Erythrobacter colymbi]|uniref:cell division protein ZapA n=1 Tax=Erythrobacter colymbi TaxID=1161202 RepID=UPI000A3AF953|nr:cell division protein ZapA [Erythrobacter colymbi]